MPGATVDDLMARAQRKVEKFLRESGQFQSTCDATFAQLDYNHTGRVATRDAVQGIGGFFQQMASSLEDFGMAVKEPSPAQVRALLADAGLEGREQLNRDQFEGLYLGVLKVAAGKCARSFAQKYGRAITFGTAGLFVAKRVVRSVPIVGLLASPVLALVPTLIVGPVIGVLGVYCLDHGGVEALKDLWGNVKEGGGFISG